MIKPFLTHLPIRQFYTMLSCNFIRRLISLGFLLQMVCYTYAAWLTRDFHMHTNLAPRPMTVVFGLGTRLRIRVCMHTALKNSILHNGKQLISAVCSMKTLSGSRALRSVLGWNDDELLATWSVFEISLMNIVVLARKKKTKKWHFHITWGVCGIWVGKAICIHWKTVYMELTMECEKLV